MSARLTLFRELGYILIFAITKISNNSKKWPMNSHIFGAYPRLTELGYKICYDHNLNNSKEWSKTSLIFRIYPARWGSFYVDWAITGRLSVRLVGSVLLHETIDLKPLIYFAKWVMSETHPVITYYLMRFLLSLATSMAWAYSTILDSNRLGDIWNRPEGEHCFP